MEHLTADDWRTIWVALALLDNCSNDPVHWREGEDEDAFVQRILRTRRKVWQRIPETARP